MHWDEARGYEALFKLMEAATRECRLVAGKYAGLALYRHCVMPPRLSPASIIELEHQK
jgi:hypothetical protein